MVDFRWLVPILFGVFFLSAADSRAEARLALVVGAADYGGVASLSNPVRDAGLMAGVLEEAGFSGGKPLVDPNLGELKDAVRKLKAVASQAGRDTTVVFYFAGHAVTVEGQPHLIPTRSDLFQGAPSIGDFENYAVSLKWVLGELQSTNVARILIVLDACRTSPFGSRAAPPVEWGEIPVASNGPSTLVLFAAEPGKAAADAPNAPNSPFTQAFVASIRSENVDLRKAWDATVQMVSSRTLGQTPQASGAWFPFTFKRAQAAEQKLGFGSFAASPAGGGDALLTLGRSGESGIAEARFRGAEDGRKLLEEALRTRTLDQLRAAAAGGDGFSMYLVGIAYWDGLGGARSDLAEARQWMKRAVAQRQGRAANSLGLMALSKNSGDAGDAEATEWFRVATELGVSFGAHGLGIQYRDGAGISKPDLLEAERLFLQAVSAGDISAYYSLADIYINSKYGQVNTVKARGFLEGGLSAGYLDAAVGLTNLDRWDLGGPRNMDKAVSRLEDAGRRGCVACWTRLAELRADPNSGVADPVSATQAYQQAAQAGDPDAMYALAQRLARGVGAPADRKLGFHWAEQARLAGHLEAIGWVGRALARGEGVDRDPERAAVLLREVLLFEDDPAKKNKIYVVNYWNFGQALADLHATNSIRGASSTEARRLYARYGNDAVYKGFSFPIDCRGVKADFAIYVTDWGRDEPSTDEQAQWVQEERQCTVPADVLEFFRKVYATSRETKVSFEELVVREAQLRSISSNGAGAPAAR